MNADNPPIPEGGLTPLLREEGLKLLKEAAREPFPKYMQTIPYPDSKMIWDLRSEALRWIEEHRPNETTTFRGSMYLEKYWLFMPEKAGGQILFLHRYFDANDNQSIHDHSWNNVSLVLDGALLEAMPGRKNERADLGVQTYRPHYHAHRITSHSKSGAVSLVATSEKKQDWAFITANGQRMPGSKLLRSTGQWVSDSSPDWEAAE